MPYSLENRLVIGVASSAMFDLAESDAVFRAEGEAAYRKYQEDHLNDTLRPGVAFSFVRRLLSLNDLRADPDDPLVEVVLLSHNDPDTGLRVMKSIEAHKLGITRAIFMQGRAPYEYIPALEISLFLSANQDDVLKAIQRGYPAGYVMASTLVDDEDDADLRIAFDFDGVLVDDESESVMQATASVARFHEHETRNLLTPHNPGPLQDFLMRVARIQAVEVQHRRDDPSYQNRLRVSVVTARNAPSHERALNTLKSWGVMVNDAFFLGGIEKRKVLAVLRPHIFFDDQSGHLLKSASVVPSVHIPFGVTNRVLE
ncbi:5'-nucleotidase [Amantichitinum ursilacus]|uniref:5'-nucleotidase n=1 Tax=Amantichitinum ursilacus TaxID=857265 RepID=A0A0N1JRX9_9NEIS|nr:5'-nucleotidase [Amantichitinum ursilacus]KPC50151.1 5'-nucleotidase [Amantichitinum ursilacus]